MKATLAEVAIIGGYIEGAQRRNPHPSGATHYERVSFVSADSGRALEYDLAPTVNGGRPASGEKVRFEVMLYPRRVKKARQDGSLYDSRAFDLVVTGFQSA
jgi:hypothetical protein